MKSNELVASRELCEKLVKLGVVMDTFFVWAKSTVPCCQDRPPHVRATNIAGFGNYPYEVVCPAPTVTELEEVLPDKIRRDEYSVYDSFCVTSTDGKYYASMDGESMGDISCLCEIEADTLANAMILMLIWLLENGHLNPEDVE